METGADGVELVGVKGGRLPADVLAHLPLHGLPFPEEAVGVEAVVGAELDTWRGGVVSEVSAETGRCMRTFIKQLVVVGEVVAELFLELVA